MGAEEFREVMREIEELRREESGSWLGEMVWLAKVKWLKARLMWRRFLAGA